MIKTECRWVSYIVISLLLWCVLYMCACLPSCNGPALNECQLALVQAWAPMRSIDTSLGLDCLVSMQPWSCSLITPALRPRTAVQTTLHWGWPDATKHHPHAPTSTPFHTPLLSYIGCKEVWTYMHSRTHRDLCTGTYMWKYTKVYVNFFMHVCFYISYTEGNTATSGYSFGVSERNGQKLY